MAEIFKAYEESKQPTTTQATTQHTAMRSCLPTIVQLPYRFVKIHETIESSEPAASTSSGATSNVAGKCTYRFY